MNKPKERQQLELQLINLITKAQAHIGFDDAIKDIQPAHRGSKIEKLPYTIWQLVEHLRIAQADILDFSRNPDYENLNWPDDYWPHESAPESEKVWQSAVQQIRSDQNEFIKLIENAEDLFQPFDWGNGQNLVREAMLIADHNAYHVGQIMILKRLLDDY